MGNGGKNHLQDAQVMKDVLQPKQELFVRLRMTRGNKAGMLSFQGGTGEKHKKKHNLANNDRLDVCLMCV